MKHGFRLLQCYYTFPWKTKCSNHCFLKYFISWKEGRYTFREWLYDLFFWSWTCHGRLDNYRLIKDSLENNCKVVKIYIKLDIDFELLEDFCIYFVLAILTLIWHFLHALLFGDFYNKLSNMINVWIRTNKYLYQCFPIVIHKYVHTD